MTLRMTIFYNQNNRGWTETFYKDGDLPPLTLDAPTKNILSKSIAFRAPTTTIYGMRISVVDNPAIKAKPYNFGDTYSGGVSGSTDTGPEVVSTVGQWRLLDQLNNARMLEIRGINDHDVKRNTATGADAPTAILVGAVDSYLNAAYGQNWQIRVAKKQGAGLLQQVQVLSMVPSAANANHTDLTVASDLGLQVLGVRKIRFYGIPKNDLAGFPSYCTIITKNAVAPFHITIPYRLRQGAIYTPANLRVIPAEYVYNKIQDWSFSRFTERKTGRPSGSLRGRSRVGTRRV